MMVGYSHDPLEKKREMSIFSTAATTRLEIWYINYEHKKKVEQLFLLPFAARSLSANVETRSESAWKSGRLAAETHHGAWLLNKHRRWADRGFVRVCVLCYYLRCLQYYFITRKRL